MSWQAVHSMHVCLLASRYSENDQCGESTGGTVREHPDEAVTVRGY